MRKLLLLAVSLLLTVTTIFAERVSQADAALVAKNFMSAPAVQTGVKKAVPTKMVLKKAASAEENQYYVYENANGEGWVMVAANDAAYPILAYSPTGKFNTENQPKNVKRWLRGYDNQIKYAEKNDIAATEEVQEEWRKLRTSPPLTPMGNVVVSPLIKTTWDQDDPYWKYCPSKGSEKTYVGCVATAMAQVMNYWQWPKHGTGSHSYTSEQNSLYCEADFGATTYDWDNMVDHYTNYYSGTNTIPVSTPTNAQKEAVSTLMYHCGVAVEMDYGVASQGGSGAMTIYSNASATDSRCAANALWTHFGYKKSSLKCYYRPGGYGYSTVSDATWLNLLKTELDAARPIMYGGADDEGGHSFVCDGYDDKNYFHFNWGWSGYCDGWYTVDNMVPGTGGSGAGNGSYNDDQDIIIGIEPDKTEVTITWSVAGTTTTTTQYTGSLILPTAPSDCAGGKKFVGWTAHSTITGGARPSDLFTSGSGITVTTNKTYYAVFATLESSGGTPSTTTYTFKSKAWGDDTNSWTSSKDGMQVASGKGVQVTSGFSGAGAAMSASSSGVTKVVVNYCTNGSSGAGSIEVKVGSSTLSKDVTKSGGTTLRDLEFDFSNASGAVSFTVTCTTNSIYVNAITITAGGGATYSDYSLDCGVVETKTLQSIAVNTDNVKKAFTVGDAFSSTGLVVTATYKGDETSTITTADVTDFTVSTPDMTSAGEKTVTVSYTYGSVTKTATYTITVAEPQTYTISFYNNGQLIGTAQTVVEGDSPTVPANPTTECTDFSFVGWAKAEQTTETTTKPTLVSDFTATQDQNYYAIFSRTENSQSGGSSNFSGAGTYKIYADVSGTKYYLTGNANSSSKIESTTTESEAPEFTIAAVTGGYTIKTGDKYIKYNGSSTNVGVSTTAYTWTITASTAGFGSFRVGASTATTRALAFANNTYKTFGGYATSNINGSDYFDLEIVGNGSSSTTYYTSAPSCTPAVVCELTGITLNTSSVKKDFFVGDAFTSAGLVVTAAYSNCDSKNVTATVTAPDMTTAGTKQVTVSYTENEVTKTASYNITVNELPVVNTYTVTWHACDGNKVVTYKEGDPLVFPTTPTPNAGKTFYGWITDEHYTGATAPAIISAGTPVNADADYYAVYE